MSYGNSEFENAPEAFDRSAWSFFGAMAGFILLDLILLFWLLNPFSGLAPETHASPLVDRQPLMIAPAHLDSAAAAKPSPLGAPVRTAARRSANRDHIQRTTPALVEVEQ